MLRQVLTNNMYMVSLRHYKQLVVQKRSRDADLRRACCSVLILFSFQKVILGDAT